LVNKIAEIHTELYHRDAEIVVAAILEEIVEALSRGDRIEIRGFGVFAVKHRKARVGRNPGTGELVQVKDKMVPYFKPGKEMRARLNG
jgi:integration host factor subunit beta